MMNQTCPATLSPVAQLERAVLAVPCESGSASMEPIDLASFAQSPKPTPGIVPRVQAPVTRFDVKSSSGNSLCAAGTCTSGASALEYLFAPLPGPTHSRSSGRSRTAATVPRGVPSDELQARAQQEADQNESRKLLMQMATDRRRTDMEIWQMMREMQTYIFSVMQNCMLNRAKACSKFHEQWLKYISS